MRLVGIISGPQEKPAAKLHPCAFLHSVGKSTKTEQRNVFHAAAHFWVKGGLSTSKIESFPTSTSC